MADYFQFYLADASSAASLPTDWGEDDLKARLLVGREALIAFTARNMEVPLTIVLHEEQPEIDLEDADHVVIGGFYTSGKIVIAGLIEYLPEAHRISVPAGNISAMVVSNGLGTLSEDGIEGGDHYTVHLWPRKADEIIILRQWAGDEPSK